MLYIWRFRANASWSDAGFLDVLVVAGTAAGAVVDGLGGDHARVRNWPKVRAVKLGRVAEGFLYAG